jgi:hypothetical protein
MQSETDRELLDIVRDLNRTQSEIDRKIIDLITTLANSVTTVANGLRTTSETVVLAQRLQAELDTSKQGLRGKLRTAIKRLIGD